MGRRFFHVKFWVGNLTCALTMASAMMAFGPSQNPPNMEGVWDGFYLATDGATGRVESDVTRQDFRRLAGRGTLFDLQNGDVSYRFDATMARADFVNGTGEAAAGRLNFQADLETYAGRGGDAGVMFPQYHFVPSPGDSGRVGAILLHPFPGAVTPDISGSGRGTFASLPDPNIPGDVADPNFKGVGLLQISPRSARGSFAGRVEFFVDKNKSPVISWPLLATASADGRVIMVSQGAAGKITYDGNLIPAKDEKSPDFVWGVFRLQFHDGQSLFGAINFNLAR